MRKRLMRLMRGFCDVIETVAFCVSVLLGQDEPDTFRAWSEFWKGEEERTCR